MLLFLNNVGACWFEIVEFRFNAWLKPPYTPFSNNCSWLVVKVGVDWVFVWYVTIYGWERFWLVLLKLLYMVAYMFLASWDGTKVLWLDFLFNPICLRI